MFLIDVLIDVVGNVGIPAPTAYHACLPRLPTTPARPTSATRPIYPHNPYTYQVTTMLKDVWGSLTDMRQDMSDVKGQLEAGLVEMRAGFKNVCIHTECITPTRGLGCVETTSAFVRSFVCEATSTTCHPGWRQSRCTQRVSYNVRARKCLPARTRTPAHTGRRQTGQAGCKTRCDATETGCDATEVG